MVKSSKKVVAIGEVGLDYFRDKSKQTAEIQLAALKQFLTLAQELQKPVVFHCRDAYGDLLTLLKDYSGIKGVVHCFNGTLDQAQQFIAIGMKLSVTAIITYPANETLRQIVKQLSLEELMLETDCPFLSPQDQRGLRNEPSNVIRIAEKVAEIKGISLDSVLQITTKNAVELFGLNNGN